MTTRPGESTSGEAGFTLIELLVAMVVLGIFMATFAIAISSTIRHSDVVQEQTALQAEARAAVDRLVRDLRQATSGIEGTCPIASATPTSIRFFSPDVQVPYHQRTVAVQLTGDTLQRAFSTSTNTAPPWSGMWTTPPANAWATQLGSITSSTLFTYYDAKGVPIAAPVASGSLGSIKMVDVSITTAPKNASERSSTYGSRATLRATAC